MCSLESDYTSEGSEKEAFQWCINLDAQKQWPGLGQGKDKPLTKEIIFLGPAQLGFFFSFRLLCEVTQLDLLQCPFSSAIPNKPIHLVNAHNTLVRMHTARERN